MWGCIASGYHLFLGHFTYVLYTECPAHTLVFLAKLIKQHELGMLHLVATLYNATSDIFSDTNIVSIVSFRALSAKYPVELLISIETTYQNVGVSIVLQIMHREEFVLHFHVLLWFYDRHFAFRECPWIYSQVTLCHIKCLFKIKLRTFVLVCHSFHSFFSFGNTQF